MVNDILRPTADATSNGGVVISPQSRRLSLASPWASVVRGDPQQELTPTAADAAGTPVSSSYPPTEQASALENTLIESSGSEAQSEHSDVNGDRIAVHERRPAWSRPVNGVIEPASVMGGAVSWPALSETTRPVLRSSPDNRRTMSDVSASSSQAPIISQPPQQPANNNAHNHGNSTVSNPPTRQRSRNRGGGGGGGGGGSSSGSGPSQTTFYQPSRPMTPPFLVFDVPYGMTPSVMDTPVRGVRPVGGSQSNTGNGHSSHRNNNNNSRRGNYGSRPRGEGQYHNYQGGRRDQDRPDVHHHHPTPYVHPPMGYMPPPLPPGAGSFMGPPPVRVFPGQMGFDMTSHFIYLPTMNPESFGAMPFVPSPPHMLFSPTNETSLTHMIVKQIDFYFSDDNLVKDNFLRSNMDDQGWVPIALIANFRRVQQLTKDISVILESLRYSTVVEVQSDKLRRRNEWSKWLHSSVRCNSESGTNSSSRPPENVLTTSLQNEGQPEMGASESSHDELTGHHPELANGEDVAGGPRSCDI